MGYWGNLNIARGKFRSGATNSNLAAGADWEPTVNFRGTLWGVYFRVDAVAQSHLSYFDIMLNSSVFERIFPHDDTFADLKLHGWDEGYTSAKLVEYNDNGICAFQFWFPYGVPVETQVYLKIHNGAAVLNAVHTMIWYEEY